MKVLSRSLLAVLPLVAMSYTASADDFACNEAVGTFNEMLIHHAEAFKKYAECLNLSRGKDDCSIEFEELKRSQVYYESDVSTIREYCSPY